MPLTEVTSRASPGSALYKLGMIPVISLVFHKPNAFICFAFKAVILDGIFWINSSCFWAVTTNSSKVFRDSSKIKTGMLVFLYFSTFMIGCMEEKLIWLNSNW